MNAERLSVEKPLAPDARSASPAIEAIDVGLAFADAVALRGVTLRVPKGRITALIGGAGSGKSAFLRTLNRLNDEVPDARVSGKVLVHGQDIYARSVDIGELRRDVGMVFRRPNPLPGSVVDNVSYGLRVAGERSKSAIAAKVEAALQRVGLWQSVGDRLKERADKLPLDQQQHLCLARALAVSPRVLLLDEPTTLLDPTATARFEDLLGGLRGELTLVIVTHNVPQASRISDTTAFFNLGELVESGPTSEMFTRPRLRQTEDYITGRFG